MARSKYKKHEADIPPAETDTPEVSQAQEPVSRSARKRESDAMKALGMKLAELSVRQLKDMELGEPLFNAITDYQRITSNSAKRRQRGFIGGLLRDEPDGAEAIQMRFKAITQHDADAKRVHHQLEEWRERLIEDDSALTDFLNQFNNDTGTDSEHRSEISVQELRTMIRRVRTAKDEAQRKKATKLLYRKLSSLVDRLST